MEHGTRVFVPHERLVWAPATVLSVDADGKRFRVLLDPVRDLLADSDAAITTSDERDDDVGEEREIDLRDDNMPDALPLQNAPPVATDTTTVRTLQHSAITPGLLAGAAAGADDMCELSHLHEPAIVYNVRARFLANAPYTFTGKIVIAVNPYQWLKSLYSDALRDLYTQHAWSDLPPHVYATSAEAFRNMVTHRQPQSILVSGESGAGKTETVKILMEHLASISLANAAKRPTPSTASTPNSSIVAKVLKSNPLLEAFGNAKTTRNDNSSRFGKFTQLQFDRSLCLVGAECRHYLLEKSRVVAQARGERNYHVFYQLVSACEPQFGFSNDDTAAVFRYLQDEPLVLDGASDLERYQVTRDALTTIGLDSAEQTELFRALCGILRLGQLDFVALETSRSDSASQPLPSQRTRELALCADLLGVDVDALATHLCSRSVKARQEVYCVPLSTAQASNNRDALAKELYARTFAYLVRRVNYSIADGSSTTTSASYAHIDLLDIFGFESFDHNSFEQFCINFANEKLQQKFTADVFQTVQAEYAAEGVAWTFVAFRDNHDMLELLESSLGLMALLNEECVRPQGSDTSFASKIVTLHDANPRLARARLSATHFVLHHYAGAVTYDATGFVEKNKDALQSDLLELLATSSNGLLALMFGTRANTAFLTDADLAAAHAEASLLGTDSCSSTSRTSGGSQYRSSMASSSVRKTSSFMHETVSYKFKAQLALLMSDIASTEVHYVRCIKPNAFKSPRAYDMDAVVHQLRSAGVVEAIRITRAAFPNKMRHEKFLRRFVVMKRLGRMDGSTVSIASQPPPTAAEACEQLALTLLATTSFGSTNSVEATRPPVVVGRSLIYFAKDVLESLERARTIFVHDCARCLQRSVRQWLAQRRMQSLRAAVTMLQAHQRRRVAQQQFERQRAASIQIQRVWRGKRSRTRAYVQRTHRSAVLIQAAVRRWQAQVAFATFREAVVKVQAHAKMRKQVGKYHSLLSAQREQATMETEVDLLKRRLDEEKRARVAIEAQNSSLQHALQQVRRSSATAAVAASVAVGSSDDNDLLPPYSTDITHQQRRQISDHRASLDDAQLLDDSERMLEYLRQEVTKARSVIQAVTRENEVLKAENKKVKDAYTAAGASFAALNQHNKQQSKANLRLMSTHAALIKSQEEKMKKYQQQVADLKDDLKMQRNVYAAELRARVQQQDVLVDLLGLAERHGVPDDVLERMRTMALDSQPRRSGNENGTSNSKSQAGPLATQYAANSVVNRSSRSDTISSTGPVPVSVGNASSGVPPKHHLERRSTIDSILNNPVQRPYTGSSGDYGASTYEPPQDTDRVSYVQSGSSNSTSVYFDESNGGHRKSRIGGMFKKMFKKDEQ